MLQETRTGREYRMDAARDCLTLSLLCLVAPCRKPGRQHCTTLYGLLTRPRCTWWTSLCRTGTGLFFCFFFYVCVIFNQKEGIELLNCLRICGLALASHRNQTAVEILKHVSELEKNNRVNNFVEMLSIKMSLSAVCISCLVLQSAVRQQRKA